MKLNLLMPTLCLAAAGLVAGARLVAEPAAAARTAAMAGDPYFARFVTATGGEAAIRQRTSRLTKGKITAPAMGVTGAVEILQATPGRIFQTFELGLGLTLTMGSDGKVAWLNVPGLGVQELEGEQREQFLDDADLFKVLNLGRRFTKSEVRAPQKLKGIVCDVIQATTQSGKVETFYFSRTDGLLLRWDREIITQSGDRARAESWLEDYRTVDGLKVPFRIRQPKPATAAFDLQVTEVKHGVTVPDAKFNKPAH